MDGEVNTIRLLGAAQLLVFAASMVSERLLASVVGSGTISTILANITRNVTRLRISNLFALVNSLAIVTLGVLFYITFYREYRIAALLGLGFFLAEAIVLALSKIGTYALIPPSRGFVEAGAPAGSHLQTLGDFLYYGVDRTGYDIHMLFFCAGGIIWYTLLYLSRSIPEALSIWGLAAISLLTVPVLVGLYTRGSTPLMILGLPYAPYEVVLGLWLIIKGSGG